MPPPAAGRNRPEQAKPPSPFSKCIYLAEWEAGSGCPKFRNFGVVPKSMTETTFGEAMKRVATIERVALYARASTKDGRQDVENQLIALREYCGKQD